MMRGVVKRMSVPLTRSTCGYFGILLAVIGGKSLFLARCCVGYVVVNFEG